MVNRALRPSPGKLGSARLWFGKPVPIGVIAAVMVYRHGNHEIDLFAWPDRGADLPGATTTRGFHIVFWKARDMDFAAVSDMDPAAFQKFVGLVRAQRE